MKNGATQQSKPTARSTVKPASEKLSREHEWESVIVSGGDSGLSDEQIAVRAHEKWMARGCPLGDGAEDWFAARTELEAELLGLRVDQPHAAAK